MAFRSVESPDNISGRILLFRMPGRFEPFGEFLEQAARMGVTDVLCLTPMEEIAVKSPEYHRAIRAGGLPFQWHQIGIPDYGTPADPEGFRAEIEEVSSRLSRGAVVLVHCAVGIQRTGLVAVCLLQRLGVRYEEALALVTYAGSEPSKGQRMFGKQLFDFGIERGCPSDCL
jgi:protein-tyrosine phosphatase